MLLHDTGCYGGDGGEGGYQTSVPINSRLSRFILFLLIYSSTSCIKSSHGVSFNPTDNGGKIGGMICYGKAD